MTDKLQSALDLAAKGLRVFPLVENGKTPLFPGWPRKATTDRDTIKSWWVDGVTGWQQDFNIGVATGHGLVVLDVDVKDGKPGMTSLSVLELMHGGFATGVVETPSGGRHYYLFTPRPIRNSVCKLADGVDVRGEGGYVVGPGSMIDGRAYEWVTDDDRDHPR